MSSQDCSGPLSFVLLTAVALDDIPKMAGELGNESRSPGSRFKFSSVVRNNF